MVSRFKLRTAQLCDMQAVHDLSNDPLVRRNSINQDFIPFETHEKWFHERLVDEDTLFYVAEAEDGRFVGQVRFQKEECVWVVSISIAPEFRGRHLSGEFLSEAIRLSGVSPVRAVVRRDNIPSLTLFERYGFKKEDFSKVGKDFISLVWQPNKELSE